MVVSLQTARSTNKHWIAFTKAELNAILSIYSYQVAKGQWRDYALDFMKQMAVFSIFRHAHETPLVSIVKLPANTASGFVFEVFFEKKRLSRSAELSSTLDALRDTLA
jgi:Protein of unknown function (DUF2794)